MPASWRSATAASPLSTSSAHAVQVVPAAGREDVVVRPALKEELGEPHPLPPQPGIVPGREGAVEGRGHRVLEHRAAPFAVAGELGFRIASVPEDELRHLPRPADAPVEQGRVARDAPGPGVDHVGVGDPRVEERPQGLQVAVGEGPEDRVVLVPAVHSRLAVVELVDALLEEEPHRVVGSVVDGGRHESQRPDRARTREGSSCSRACIRGTSHSAWLSSLALVGGGGDELPLPAGQPAALPPLEGGLHPGPHFLRGVHCGQRNSRSPKSSGS